MTDYTAVVERDESFQFQTSDTPLTEVIGKVVDEVAPHVQSSLFRDVIPRIKKEFSGARLEGPVLGLNQCLTWTQMGLISKYARQGIREEMYDFLAEHDAIESQICAGNKNEGGMRYGLKWCALEFFGRIERKELQKRVKKLYPVLETAIPKGFVKNVSVSLLKHVRSKKGYEVADVKIGPIGETSHFSNPISANDAIGLNVASRLKGNGKVFKDLDIENESVYALTPSDHPLFACIVEASSAEVGVLICDVNIPISVSFKKDGKVVYTNVNEFTVLRVSVVLPDSKLYDVRRGIVTKRVSYSDFEVRSYDTLHMFRRMNKLFSLHGGGLLLVAWYVRVNLDKIYTLLKILEGKLPPDSDFETIRNAIGEKLDLFSDVRVSSGKGQLLIEGGRLSEVIYPPRRVVSVKSEYDKKKSSYPVSSGEVNEETVFHFKDKYVSTPKNSYVMNTFHIMYVVSKLIAKSLTRNVETDVYFFSPLTLEDVRF